MKKFLLLTLTISILLSFYSFAFAESTPESIIDEAISVLEEFSSESDVSDMASMLKTSHAIAIVPSMVKAGFLLGGEYGEGLILKHEKGKWYIVYNFDTQEKDVEKVKEKLAKRAKTDDLLGSTGTLDHTSGFTERSGDDKYFNNNDAAVLLQIRKAN
ncbi:MAG: hypothetical protein IJQ57_02890 [Synergistaceae bacterium]|nr:hypothetical protein [Synergistaceae bacterium]